MALLFADKPRLAEALILTQDAKLLIDVRNRLVHFRSATQTHGEEQQLKGKFAENALMAGSVALTPKLPVARLYGECLDLPIRSGTAAR